jgi:uncharacterized protein (TIGR02996 family)
MRDEGIGRGAGVGEEGGFRRAILGTPEDPTARLVYAGWLEERVPGDHPGTGTGTDNDEVHTDFGGEYVFLRGGEQGQGRSMSSAARTACSSGLW